MRVYSILCLSLLALPPLGATILTGRVSDLTGQSLTNQTFIRFTLENCTANVPRVTGSTSFAQKVLDVLPDGSGSLHGSIAGNDAITCDAAGTTYYLVQVWNGQAKLYEGSYYITGTIWNLVTATPFNPQTGLPAGNSGSTALIGDVNTQGSNATVSGLAGKPLASSASNPTGGTALVFNQATGKWTPTYIPQTLYLNRAPTAADGNNGDTVIDTFNKQICGPKTTGTWPACTALGGNSTPTPTVTSPVVRHYTASLVGGANIITHNLGTLLFDLPVVVDQNGNQVGWGDFQSIDLDTVNIMMAPGFTGTAYLTGYVPTTKLLTFPFSNATNIPLAHNAGTMLLSAVVRDAGNAVIDYSQLTPVDANNATLTLASPATGVVYLTCYITTGAYFEKDFSASDGNNLTFTHNLGATNVQVTVYDAVWDIIGTNTIATPTANTVQVQLSPALNGHVLISPVQ